MLPRDRRSAVRGPGRALRAMGNRHYHDRGAWATRAVVAVMAATTLSVGVALADGPVDPNDPTATPNTPYTPQPQPYDDATSPWQYVGGLRLDGGAPQSRVPGNSQTPKDVNFFA